MKILAILTLLAFVSCEASFQSRIPNGYNVMGNSQYKYFIRNLFGRDYVYAGEQWTTALCNADSDGDGFSNGMELGDPNCEWTPGSTPSRVRSISHPGYNDSVPAFGRSSTCPVAPRATPFFGNSSIACTKAKTCLTSFCDCLGLVTVTSSFSCGAAKQGSTIVRNCSTAARCISRRMKCVNGAADDTASGCAALKDLKMANIAVAGGQLYNQSNAFKSCKHEACKMLNETAGASCPLDYGQLCRSPVRFIGTMLLRGKWAAILGDQAKKAKLQIALETDLTRTLRFDCLVRKLQTGSNRRRAGDTKLVVEFEADGVSANNAELSSGVTAISNDRSGSFLTETLAQFSVGGVSAGSSSSAVFSASASTAGSATASTSTSGTSTTGTTSASGSASTTSSSATGSQSGSTSDAAHGFSFAAFAMAIIVVLVW